MNRSPRAMYTMLIRVVLPLVAAMLLLGGTAIYHFRKASMSRAFEDAMWQDARHLAGLVSFDEGRFAFQQPPEAIPPFKPGPDARFFSITLPDGKLLAATPGIPVGVPSAAKEFVLPDGSRGRAITLQHVVRARNEKTIPNLTQATAFMVRVDYGRSLQSLDNSIRVLHSTLLVSGALLFVVAAAALALVMAVCHARRRTERPPLP